MPFVFLAYQLILLKTFLGLSGSLKYLINLEKRFDYKALQRITQKGESYTRGWLLKRRREGIIEKEKERVWKLTEEGQRIKNILHNIQAMENEARDLDAVQNKL